MDGHKISAILIGFFLGFATGFLYFFYALQIPLGN